MAALLALLLATPGVSLDIEPGVTCVTRETLGRRLEAGGEPLVTSASALRISVRKSPGGIWVEGVRNDGRRFTREVPLEDDCASVERAVTLLALTWAREEQLPTLTK